MGRCRGAVVAGCGWPQIREASQPRRVPEASPRQRAILQRIEKLSKSERDAAKLSAGAALALVVKFRRY